MCLKFPPKFGENFNNRRHLYYNVLRFHGRSERATWFLLFGRIDRSSSSASHQQHHPFEGYLPIYLNFCFFENNTATYFPFPKYNRSNQSTCRHVVSVSFFFFCPLAVVVVSNHTRRPVAVILLRLSTLPVLPSLVFPLYYSLLHSCIFVSDSSSSDTQLFPLTLREQSVPPLLLRPHLSTNQFTNQPPSAFSLKRKLPFHPSPVFCILLLFLFCLAPFRLAPFHPIRQFHSCFRRSPWSCSDCFRLLSIAFLLAPHRRLFQVRDYQHTTFNSPLRAWPCTVIIIFAQRIVAFSFCHPGGQTFPPIRHLTTHIQTRPHGPSGGSLLVG